MSKKMAFLMTSCDAYEDLWNPFFECLDKVGGGVNCAVYLNTEAKQFNSKRDLSFKVNTINQKGDSTISWSRRMIDALNRIPEEYVFLVLDDFFVCDNIIWDSFDKLIDFMEKDSKIASIQFCGTRVRNAAPNEYLLGDSPDLELMKRGGWKTHFVPTIWRKSVLLKWLRPWETIWAFEECGSKRANRWNYSEKVYVVKNQPIYDYLWIKDCSAVINGKWLADNELIDFFNSNEIDVDWTKRGKMTYEEYLAITMKDVIKKYSAGDILLKFCNRIRSVF